MTVRIEPGDTVVFMGDSITNCGRDRTDPGSLGHGYAALVAEGFEIAEVRFVNRGISGNHAVDLRERWDRDCTALNPDVVSIMIGINEVWRGAEGGDPTPTAVFEDHYRYLLEQTTDQAAQLILLEPFLLPVNERQHLWREDLDAKLAVVRALAKEYAATLVPTDRLMTEAAVEAGGPEVLAEDGVHPTPAGHAVLAEAWLTAVGHGG